MNNMAKNNESKTWAFILTLVGSLVYLYIVWNWLGNPVANAVFGGAGAVFYPLVVGLAVVSAVGLFLMSFSFLRTSSDELTMHAGKASMIAGVTLVALTVGSGMVWWAILGFALVKMGHMAAKM